MDFEFETDPGLHLESSPSSDSEDGIPDVLFQMNSFRKALENKFNLVPWEVICIRGENFLFKCMFEELTYRVMASDLIFTYSEELCVEAIEERSVKLNPKLRYKANGIVPHLKHIFNKKDESSHQREILVRDGRNLKMSVAYMSPVAQTLFTWEFEMMAARPIVMYKTVTMPLRAFSEKCKTSVKELFESACAHEDLSAKIPSGIPPPAPYFKPDSDYRRFLRNLRYQVHIGKLPCGTTYRDPPFNNLIRAFSKYSGGGFCAEEDAFDKFHENVTANMKVEESDDSAEESDFSEKESDYSANESDYSAKESDCSAKESDGEDTESA